MRSSHFLSTKATDQKDPILTFEKATIKIKKKKRNALTSTTHTEILQEHFNFQRIEWSWELSEITVLTGEIRSAADGFLQKILTCRRGRLLRPRASPNRKGEEEEEEEKEALKGLLDGVRDVENV